MKNKIILFSFFAILVIFFSGSAVYSYFFSFDLLPMHKTKSGDHDINYSAIERRLQKIPDNYSMEDALRKGYIVEVHQSSSDTSFIENPDKLQTFIKTTRESQKVDFTRIILFRTGDGMNTVSAITDIYFDGQSYFGVIGSFPESESDVLQLRDFQFSKLSAVNTGFGYAIVLADEYLNKDMFIKRFTSSRMEILRSIQLIIFVTEDKGDVITNNTSPLSFIFLLPQTICLLPERESYPAPRCGKCTGCRSHRL